MQPQPPGLPRVYSYPEASDTRSRVYVHLFAWFGLLIAILHLFEGRSMGFLQMLVSVIGIYASWDSAPKRRPSVATYTVGCFIWVILDGLYLLLLIAACSTYLHRAMVGLVVSNSFPNLAPSLDAFFDALAADAHFFSIFSAVTSVFFDYVALYWAFALYKDVLEAAAASSDVRVPLLRPPPNPPRSGISGFGTLSRQNPTPQPPSRSINPFTGRGHRLGFAET